MNAAIVWGGLAGASLIALTAAPVGDAIGRLNAARAEWALAGAIPSPHTDAPIVSPNQAVKDAAGLVERLRAQAARDGVLVEDAAARHDGALARARIRVSGSPEAVLHFADTIERGRPLIRFAAWRIEQVDGAVRLQGEVVAPWR